LLLLQNIELFSRKRKVLVIFAKIFTKIKMFGRFAKISEILHFPKLNKKAFLFQPCVAAGRNKLELQDLWLSPDA
jgi:hypothetical protein